MALRVLSGYLRNGQEPNGVGMCQEFVDAQYEFVVIPNVALRYV